MNEEKINKTYSQEEYDAALASTRKRFEAKIEKDYVSIEKYNELTNQINALKQSNKTNIIAQHLGSFEIKKEAINDFIKLNPSLYEIEETQLNDKINELKKDYAYMFNEKKEFISDPLKKVESNEQHLNLNKLSKFFTK